MKNINTKLTQKQTERYINLALFVFSLFIILYGVFFLYQNFYLTVTQSDEIIIMQKNVIKEKIDIKNFEEIIKNLEEKSKTNKTENLNNPFQ